MTVIVPVYNVENYVDKCLSSIVNQSYDNLEILIMEAESTDNSLERVNKWAKLDERIIIMSKRDGGLGPGRNNGIKLARGQYITFVDSDDWISDCFVEELVQAVKEDEETDVVISDFISYAGERPVYYGGSEWTMTTYSTLEEKQEIMCYGNNSMWGKLYRTDIFIKNKIEQPALPFEDLSVWPLIVAVSGQIKICHSAIAYHLSDRAGSLFQAREDYKRFPEVIWWAEEGLRQAGMYDIYRNSFAHLMYRHFQMIASPMLGDFFFAYIKQNISEFFRYCKCPWMKYENVRYSVLGGFSLKWAGQKTLSGKGALDEFFAFTSVIGQMTSCKMQRLPTNSNLLRADCMGKDVEGRLSNEVSLKRSDYLLIDFLQECSEVLECEGNTYVTNSEALRESDFDYSSIRRVISWKDKRFWKLWKKKCSELTVRLKNRKSLKVILVKNYFSNFYYDSDGNKAYWDVKEENNILKKMYSWFETCFDGENLIGEISIPEELRYTDMADRKYEKSPVYFNEAYYTYVARKIDCLLFLR